MRLKCEKQKAKKKNEKGYDYLKVLSWMRELHFMYFWGLLFPHFCIIFHNEHMHICDYIVPWESMKLFSSMCVKFWSLEPGIILLLTSQLWIFFAYLWLLIFTVFKFIINLYIPSFTELNFTKIKAIWFLRFYCEEYVYSWL
jgi:hypothetical protein